MREEYEKFLAAPAPASFIGAPKVHGVPLPEIQAHYQKLLADRKLQTQDGLLRSPVTQEKLKEQALTMI